MLADFSRVCEKHHIKWWADAGTLLGAVRHKGFITWDDDIDICVMREDYKRLCEFAKKEFSPPYFWQTMDTEPNSWVAFAKLRNSNTTMLGASELALLKNNAGKLDYNSGIFIDIFPMDNWPEDDIYLHSHVMNIRRLYRKYCFITSITSSYVPARKLWKRPVKALLHHLATLFRFSPSIADNILTTIWEEKKALSSLDLPNGKYVAETVFADAEGFLERLIRERSWFDETEYLPFEMISVPVPSGWEHILSRQFGNWHEYVITTGHSAFYDADRPLT